MRGYRISFIRHGKTEANDKGIYIGSTDYPLSKYGREEILSKMDEFVYPKVERVYCSPLKRCTETADIIYPDREKLIVNDLRELDFGDFEGKSVDELINRDDYKQWLKGGQDAKPPNGESVQDLVLRSYRAINQIIINMMSEELYNCAVITHGGVLSNMLACFGVPKVPANELSSLSGEGYEVHVSADMWQRSQAFQILGMIPYSQE